jgi:3-methylcrotonyl-CoA carboxylase alpha subunit
MFKKILIANRGEIACRVAATARRLGIRTVAVYSDADAQARHVRMPATRRCTSAARPRATATCAGSASSTPRGHRRAGRAPGLRLPVRERGLRAGLRRGRHGLHRPAASAIAAMGSKSAAKALMERAGVPLVPGYHGEDNDPALLAREADAHRLPGADQGQCRRRRQGHAPGRAPRTSPPRWPAASARPRPASFGDDHVLVERYVCGRATSRSRSSATARARCVHLFERDCSVQRRHQKVLEEAPAPGMSAAAPRRDGRRRGGRRQAVGYVGAGTVEFIAEECRRRRPRFYFMEMNTRLQVEHPVTEAITGLDLVEWQLRVAAGEPCR